MERKYHNKKWSLKQRGRLLLDLMLSLTAGARKADATAICWI